MNNEFSKTNKGSLVGALSVAIPVLMILLILNWFFTITPYQKLSGLPILIVPFVSIIGFVLGIISVKLGSRSIGKLGIASNIVLFVLPSLYWVIGTLSYGP